MNYEEILRILGVNNNFFDYMKNLEYKFYKVKEIIDKYGEEVIINFFKDDKNKFFSDITDYIKEKEVFEEYNKFYKDKLKHKILYEKFKEGVIYIYR